MAAETKVAAFGAILRVVYVGIAPDRGVGAPAISIGFVLALWAGSSATATFVNTITIAYGQRDLRGPQVLRQIERIGAGAGGATIARRRGELLLPPDRRHDATDQRSPAEPYRGPPQCAERRTRRRRTDGRRGRRHG